MQGDKYISGSTTIERKPDGPIVRPGTISGLTGVTLPKWMWDQYCSASMNSWEYQKYVGPTFADDAQESASIQRNFDQGVQSAFSVVNHPDSSSAWVDTAMSSSMKLFGRDSGSNYLTGSQCGPGDYALYQPFWAGADGAWTNLTGSRFE